MKELCSDPEFKYQVQCSDHKAVQYATIVIT